MPRRQDLAGLIKSSGGNNSLLSARGNVGIDERTNTLLVAGHGGSSRRHSPPGVDAGHSDPPGADRGAHRRQPTMTSRAISACVSARPRSAISRASGSVARTRRELFPAAVSAARTTDIVLQPNNNNAPGGTPPAISLPNVNDRYMVNLPVAQPSGPNRAYAARLGLHSGSGAVGGTGRRTRPDHLRAARDDGEPARSGHRAGHGDSVPGSFLERCDHHSVQEGGARH